MRTLLQLCHARAIVVVLAATLTGCSRPVAPDALDRVAPAHPVILRACYG